MVVTLSIDGAEVRVPEGSNLVAAARAAGIYVPTLCHLADLPAAPAEYACGLCLVEVEGEAVRACETLVRPDLRVVSTSPDLVERRRAALGRILADHPHACLTCAQREGCVREPCSSNVPVGERCCPKLSDCEIVRLVEHVGLPPDLSRYVPRGWPVEEDPLFLWDENLCIHCGRCVRACEGARGVAALEIREVDGKLRVVPAGGSVSASGCRHCGTCVSVCPTGARRDVGPFAAGTEEAVLACHAACPAGVDVPAYVALMAEGRFAEAAAVVRNRAPLPLVLGHACYRPCEDDCRRGRLSDPVAVCDLKRVAGEADPIHPAPLPPTGRKVAVVGSGPAGLSAAHYLAALGHAVTVFESDPEPGGLLRYGIPEERLPRAAVDREVRDLADRGIEFRTGVRLGDGLAPADLEHEFDAAVLATGAGPGKRLDLPGADLEGIGTALGFLRSAARGAPTPDVTGRRVVVIGGGGVAMDAASTAARSGAEAVDVFCLESRAEMPAHPSEIGLALSLGVRLHPGWGPTGYSEKGPRVGAVELVRCLSVFDDRGRFAPRLDPATSGRAPADLVLLAVGQEPDPAIRNAEPTGIPVASAGDLVTGPANLARAVASGREAALLVHRELGLSGTPPEFVPDPPPAARLVPIEDFASLPRRPLPLDAATAAAEADRCLRCDLRFTVSLPPAPPAPHHRLGPEEIARVPAEPGVLTFFDAGLRTLFIQGVPDLRAGAAAAPDDASFFTFELSEMYTQRESELNSKLLASGAAPLVDDDLF